MESREQAEHHGGAICRDRFGIIEEDDILYLVVGHKLGQIAGVVAVIYDIEVLIMIDQPGHEAVSKGFFQNETG